MAKKSEQSFFVEVKGHTDIRRNILNTLRDILEILQQFHHFKKHREEKLKKITHLRALLKDANKQLNQIKSQFPDIKLPKAKPKKQAPKPKAQETAVSEPKAAPKQKQLSELDQLESELKHIEKKIGKLA